MSTEKFYVNEKSSIHKYRTEIPNIIKLLKLKGNEFLLYFYYKSIAGDNGACWKCLKTIEKETGLSRKTIKETNKELIRPRKELGGLSLINLEHRFKKDGSPDTSIITVVDIWNINMTHFSTQGGGGVNFTPGGVGYFLPEGGVNFTPKEDLFNKEEEEGLKIKEKFDTKSDLPNTSRQSQNQKTPQRAPAPPKMSKADRDYYNKIKGNELLPWLPDGDKMEAILCYGWEIVQTVLNSLFDKHLSLREKVMPKKIKNMVGVFYAELNKEERRRNQW